MGSEPVHITTDEAAKLTRHASSQTFLRWAHKHAEHVLVKPVGFRAYLVDRAALRYVLLGEWRAEGSTAGYSDTQTDSCTGNG